MRRFDSCRYFASRFAQTTMLRRAFTAKSLNHCRDLLKVTWGDGVQSTFPNTWLRASVRDSRFFEPVSLIYRPDHLSFIAQGSPITSVEHTDDKQHIKINWEDHTSTFNSSWLRAQDVPQSLNLREPVEEIRWGGGFNLPRYDYALKDEQMESWMTDLRKYGMIIVDNTPPNKEAMVDFMHMIGPLRQRYHPTNVFTGAINPKNLVIDYHSYGPVPIYAHTDTSYYRAPPKLLSFLYTQYNAPKEDTVSFFVDGFKVLEDFRVDEPEAYELLTSTIVRQARRRMSVEEECDPSDVPIYEWDTYRDIPLVITDGDGKLKQILTKFNKHAGFPLKDQADERMKNWYRAIQMLQNRLDDPQNHYSSIMKKGTMVVFDNHRICHGRGPIDPATERELVGCYTSGEVFQSRWRILLAKKSGLPDKWLLGCSTESLEILAHQNEPN